MNSPALGGSAAQSGGHRRRTLVQRAFRLDGENVGQRVATGAGFQILGIVLRTVLTLGSTAILARLLTPADFGYLAMATVVTEFAALIGAFGFANVLVQRRTICRLHLDTVFWATTSFGVLLAIVVFVLSYTTGWLFADQRVGPLLRLLSLTFILNGLTAVPGIVIARLMRFRAEFWINIVAVVVRVATATGFASAGFGVWSLIAGSIVGALTTMALSFASVPYMPRRRFRLALLTSTWRTSTSYFGNNLLHYVNTNVDLLLIGRQLGASVLGQYQNARSLTDEIRARIAMPIQHVLFPAFSTVQVDRIRFQQLVLRAGRWLAAIVIPIGVGVSANATELVLVLYGAQWQSMAPVMSVLALAAALRAATAISAPLFNANDRVGLGLRYNAVGTLALIGGVLAAMPFGIVAVASAIALTNLISLIACRAAFHLIGLGTLDLVKVLGAPVLAAACLWVVTLWLRQAVWSTNPALLLLAHTMAGAVAYLATLLIVSREHRSDLRMAYKIVSHKR